MPRRARRPKATPEPPAAPPPPAPPVLPEGLALGRTGRVHPPIGLGLWALGRWTREDEARTQATAARALERGVRWFDTAEVYGAGRSERILGDVLHRAVGGAPDPFVTTKVSWEHLRPAQVRAALVGSLQRLGRTSVDVYLVHAPDSRTPVAETMATLDALYREGKIRAVGVSNFSVEEMEAARAALSEAPLVVNQVLYNLLDREEGEAIRDYCLRHGIVLEAYTPLARGLLTGRYLDRERPPPEVRRFAHRVFEADRFPELRARAFALRELAREAGVPPASLALHWLRKRGAAPVFGASRPDQVDANLAAWAARPPDPVLDRADAIARGDRA